MVLNFAHRGSLTEAPENTLPAFQRAINHGARALELDVQLTKDNHLIICHDDRLTRFNPNVTSQIKAFTLDEIKQIDVGSFFSKNYAGTTLATLDELLTICPNNIVLNIEIKNIPTIYDGIEAILWNCLKSHNRTDNIRFSSFDHVALRNMHELAPDAELGMLFYYRILDTWCYVANSGLPITSIHPNQVYVDRPFVESCKQQGFQVLPYTVNSKKRYRELLDYGVDGVFSNNPDIFI